MEKKSVKRIVFEVSEDNHKLIKLQATHRNMSISDYVRQAIDEMVVRDEQYDKKTTA